MKFLILAFRLIPEEDLINKNENLKYFENPIENTNEASCVISMNIDMEKKNYEEFNNFDHYIPFDFDQSYEENIKSISRQEESKESLVDKYKLLGKREKKKKFIEESSSQDNSISSVSSDIKESKISKRVKKSKKDTELISICPNYELYSEENLKESMRSYGLKPGSNNAMIKALKEIFEFRKSKKLPDRLVDQLDTFIQTIAFNSQQEDNSNNYYSQLSIDDNGKNYLSQQCNQEKKSTKYLDDFKKQNIIKIIKENKELWTRILRMEKIELSFIKDVINKNDIIADKKSLKEFLLEKGINLI